MKGQGGGANAEPVQRRLTDYNLAQTEAALRKYMRGYFGAPLYDQSQLESLERELCVDEHQGCHLYYATGDDTHEKLKGYVAAQRRNALRQMELNRAAYEADATRHRTSIRRLTARIRTSSYPVPAIFELIQKSGDIPVRDMYNTFNMGIGLVIAIPKDQVGHALDVLARAGEQSYVIGDVIKGDAGVELV